MKWLNVDIWEILYERHSQLLLFWLIRTVSAKDIAKENNKISGNNGLKKRFEKIIRLEIVPLKVQGIFICDINVKYYTW